MRRIAAVTVTAALACLALVGLGASAQAGVRPAITSLSTHAGAYWGGRVVTVHGVNFTQVQNVRFGDSPAWGVHVSSPTSLTATAPYHSYGTVHVFVSTGSGTSPKTEAATFTFRKPTMSDPIQGGMTGAQEQQTSARVRAHHHTPATARRSSHWTAAMGSTAAHRAASWVGLPYSWAGGNTGGPSTGVCAHNGGDLDCHIVGFDCSGLALYSWGPYKTLPHLASSQHAVAGRYHPGLGELVPGDLVFFSAYIPSGIGHVAVYVGNGMVVEAPESGSTVRYSRLADLIAWDGDYRGATRPLSSGRQGSGPSVQSVTSTVSTAGGTVKFVGKHLDQTTAVGVGKTQLYRFLSRTPGHVSVALPAHRAGRVTVSVSTAWGTVRRTITYVAPPAATSLAPATGPTTGGTAVTIYGRGLNTTTQLLLGTTSVHFAHTGTSAHPTLTLTMPAHTSGPVTLTAVSRYGRSSAIRFVYAVAPKPAPVTSTSSAPARSTSPAPSSTSPAAPSTSSSSTSVPPVTAGPTPSSSTATSPSSSQAPSSPVASSPVASSTKSSTPSPSVSTSP